MKNKNLPILIGVLVIGLIAGALWGSKYGFTLKGPLANTGMQSHASNVSLATNFPDMVDGSGQDLLEGCNRSTMGTTIVVYDSSGNPYTVRCVCRVLNGNDWCGYQGDLSSTGGRASGSGLDTQTSTDLVSGPCKKGEWMLVWDTASNHWVYFSCSCDIRGNNCRWQEPPAGRNVGFRWFNRLVSIRLPIISAGRSI